MRARTDGRHRFIFSPAPFRAAITPRKRAFRRGKQGHIDNGHNPPPENDPLTLGGYKPPAARYVG